MEKVKYRYNRWRLALGRLVNLRYINRWIIFCADLFISLCVSLIGVLGLLSIMHETAAHRYVDPIFQGNDPECLMVGGGADM